MWQGIFAIFPSCAPPKRATRADLSIILAGTRLGHSRPSFERRHHVFAEAPIRTRMQTFRKIPRKKHLLQFYASSFFFFYKLFHHDQWNRAHTRPDAVTLRCESARGPTKITPTNDELIAISIRWEGGAGERIWILEQRVEDEIVYKSEWAGRKKKKFLRTPAGIQLRHILSIFRIVNREYRKVSFLFSNVFIRTYNQHNICE